MSFYIPFDRYADRTSICLYRSKSRGKAWKMEPNKSDNGVPIVRQFISTDPIILEARISKDENATKETETINLDQLISITDGKLAWGGGQFSFISQEVWLCVSISDGVKLRAYHLGGDPTAIEWVWSELDLTERIENLDGKLSWIPPNEFQRRKLAFEQQNKT